MPRKYIAACNIDTLRCDSPEVRNCSYLEVTRCPMCHCSGAEPDLADRAGEGGRGHVLRQQSAPQNVCREAEGAQHQKGRGSGPGD